MEETKTGRCVVQVTEDYEDERVIVGKDCVFVAEWPLPSAETATVRSVGSGTEVTLPVKILARVGDVEAP